jgi:hypothetical protein
MTTDGPQPLTGYPMRDYDQAIATLRQAWLTSGLSQPEIARRMGYAHHGSVTYLLNGRVEAPSRRLFDLADALGYDLALIPRNPAPEADTRPVECKLTRPAGDTGPTQRCACEVWQPCAQGTETGLSSTLPAEQPPAHSRPYVWPGCQLSGHHGCTPRECRTAADYPLQETYPGSGTYE